MDELERLEQAVEAVTGVDVPDSPEEWDAAKRSLFTLGQGAVVSGLVAVGGVLVSVSGDHVDWRLLGASVGQTFATAVVTFLWHKVRETVSK